MGFSKCLYLGPYVVCTPKRGSKLDWPFDVLPGEEFFDMPRREDGDKLYLAPNEHRKGEPRPNFDDDEDFHIDLTAVDRDAEMRWLEAAFAEELKKLRAAYAKVEVKWGLHQYFM